MKKGSITFTLCLIMLVMLSLLFAGLSSARQAVSRVVLVSATEQALFSQFARYDRELFDKYGLFFIDGGYGADSLQTGKILKEVREDAEYITNPRKGGLVGRDILDIDIEKKDTALTGYVLATDQGGAAFRRQVCSQMRAQLGEAGLTFLKNHLKEEENTQEAQEKTRKGINSAKAGQYYAQDQAGKSQAEREAEPTPAPSNPIPALQQQKRSGGGGILALVLPKDKEVSGAEADVTQMVSHRTLQNGVGMLPSAWQDPDEQVLLLEYLAEDFPCYTDTYNEDGLHYQIEYAICGKGTDQANLHSVLLRLLAAREAVNMVYLMTNSNKRQEVDAVAQGIAALVTQPELAPLFSFLLKLLWAWGESIVDLRELMRGGKVVPVKTDETWNLQLSKLTEKAGNAASDGEGETSEKKVDTGLDYKEYLRMLLLAKSKEKLTSSLMDLTEYNIRRKEEGFRLDNCIDAMQVELVGRVGRKTYCVERSYGYDMDGRMNSGS